jgi:hypothetical protein
MSSDEAFSRGKHPMNPYIFAKLTAMAAVLSLAACGQSVQQAASDSAPKAAAPAVAVAQEAPAQAKPNLAPALTPASAPDAAPVAAPVAAPAPAPQVQTVAAVPSAAHATAIPVAAAGGKPDKLVIRGFAATLPATWMPTQPSSSMRVAQFAIPPAKGAEPGEVAVFYFAPGQGGSHDANIERWSSQFTGPGGLPVMPQTSVSKSGDTEITLVELQGNYSRGIGMGPAGEPRPDQALLVAMVEAPIGRITLQLYGPSKTVAAQRDNFLKLAKGFRRA